MRAKHLTMSQTLVVAFVGALALLIPTTGGQENIMTRVAPGLLECYTNPEMFERDNRLPMTMNMLIELIRKVEDSPGLNEDMRQLSIALLHRFRQDGIVRATGVQNVAGVLPFSPSGHHFTRHRILFSRLLPGNAQTFPNNTLNAQERCALHFMLSSSIDLAVRGDENIRCNMLSQYRALRVPRDTKHPIQSNFIADVQMLAEPQMKTIRKQIESMRKSARMEVDPEDEPAAADQEEELEDPEAKLDTEAHEEILDMDNPLVDIATNARSACPVENGVVYTRWGAVSAGTVLAGIAAGLAPQSVELRNLLPPRSEQMRARQQVQPLRVDNRWAATLSGDLAEVTLLQAPSTPNNIQVGAGGAWNDTVSPRWFFLTQRDNLEMTDAEIRAGIDGLTLAMNIADWRSRVNALRLSQVLDMYYSQRGVFDQTMRSCNRRDLFTTTAPIAEMRNQAAAFSNILEREMQMAFTVTQEAMATFSTGASNALADYVPQTLNDLTCEATAIVPNDPTIWRTAADLFIYVDASWSFRDISAVVGNLLDELDVGPFGTTYTVLNALTGDVIINRTQSLADFHTQYTAAVHATQQPGLAMPPLLRSLRQQVIPIMSEERTNSSMSGRSKIALIMPNTAAVNDGDYAFEQLQIIREEIPDLRLIFLAGGTHTRFARFVRDQNRDLFQMREITSGAVIDSVHVQTRPVIVRIQQEPRRIVNPRCGHDWIQGNWGSNSINQYVEPRGVVFYRLQPNYFFQAAEARRLRIQGHGYAQLTVCQSRWVQLPRSNATQQSDQIRCQQINTETVDIDLSNACDGHPTIHACPPVFFSVEHTQQTPVTNFRCNERECRFPDNARFAVILENGGCFSSAGKLFSSLTFVVFVTLLGLLFTRQ
ncbi:uncharacterized protein LOC129747349 [Uranotaenia lowii]|uniref:uncharacterized protein LOC129747349 n=1 Tax=Uranotaenia lowii TaxID=190385 RepID=UPI00247A96B2|nr:uncharacterized protein LOC129747349 [Uranotaenia lowii]XP_055597480.1 uncharacterized protein LOC129747349 [Uranotaenia lowii]